MNKTNFWVSGDNHIAARSPSVFAQNHLDILTGDTIRKQKALAVLSDVDKKQLQDGVGGLFFGLAWMNWTNGESLGQAWQKALFQVADKIGSLAGKGPNNPASVYLQQYSAEHRKKWSKTIMTSQNSNLQMKVPADKKQEFMIMGSKWASESLSLINEKTRELASMAKDVPMPKPLQMTPQMLDMLRNR